MFFTGEIWKIIPELSLVSSSYKELCICATDRTVLYGYCSALFLCSLKRLTTFTFLVREGS